MHWESPLTMKHGNGNFTFRMQPGPRIRSAGRCFSRLPMTSWNIMNGSKELHAKWVHQEKWPESVPLEVKGTRVKDVLNEVIARMEKIPVGDKGDLDAIRTAIDFEARGAALYGRLRDAVSDPKQKAFFHLLAGIENEHYMSLRDTEELLTDPASWYRSKEHHGLDGG